MKVKTQLHIVERYNRTDKSKPENKHVRAGNQRAIPSESGEGNGGDAELMLTFLQLNARTNTVS